MSSSQDQTNESSRPKRPSLGRRLMPRAGEIIFLAIAAFCLVVLLTQDIQFVTDLVYSPLAIILVVVVFVEYLIIKGGDRSRLYRIEIEHMREREQEYVGRIRRALEAIARARGRLNEGDSASAASNECLETVRQILRPDAKDGETQPNDGRETREHQE